MNRTFYIADTHFFHKNIIKYCGRPFESVEDMNEELISKWLMVVGSSDRVIHLGDLGFCINKKCLFPVVERLTGYKILIRGNHDQEPKHVYRSMGFDEVLDGHRFKKFLFTHEPIIATKGINIHGHIHEQPLDSPNHRCVSVECTDYMPIELPGIRWD